MKFLAVALFVCIADRALAGSCVGDGGGCFGGHYDCCWGHHCESSPGKQAADNQPGKCRRNPNVNLGECPNHKCDIFHQGCCPTHICKGPNGAVTSNGDHGADGQCKPRCVEDGGGCFGGHYDCCWGHHCESSPGKQAAKDQPGHCRPYPGRSEGECEGHPCSIFHQGCCPTHFCVGPNGEDTAPGDRGADGHCKRHP